MTRNAGPQFGPIIARFEIVEAIIATLQKWQKDYLAEIERQLGLDPRFLPLMRHWERSMEGARAHMGAEPPVCIVSVRALSEEPVRRKTGTAVKFGAMVTVVASAGSQEQTERLADTYIAAFRALLEQKKTLGGVASNTVWSDERYDELGQPVDRDTLGAGSAFFEVEVDEAVHSYKGPRGEPLSDPYDTVRGAPPTVVADGMNVTINPIPTGG